MIRMFLIFKYKCDINIWNQRREDFQFCVLASDSKVYVITGPNKL